MAITLHWRRLLSLAVNKVNFHKHSGKETEFSWRGREWWRSNSLLLPVVRLSMGHRKPRSLKKWNPKERLVRWWVSHQILGKTKIIPSNDILIYKLSCFTKVCCRVAVVSGRAMEACSLSFLENLGTHSPHLDSLLTECWVPTEEQFWPRPRSLVLWPLPIQSSFNCSSHFVRTVP